ncbi:MAG: hypothetical protein QG624_287 [Pseudomonadota bacterium]|jgi:hypothetical protein|nr:hypothetical protein [Pseudomonadota bacterium]
MEAQLLKPRLMNLCTISSHLKDNGYELFCIERWLMLLKYSQLDCW